MLHRELFGSKVKEEWLDPMLLEALKVNSEAGWKGILTEEMQGVPLGRQLES